MQTAETRNTLEHGDSDGGGPTTNKYGGAPILFMSEKQLFGDRVPSKADWLKHEELYESVGTTIDPSHITGLQRVRGMWRIYVENLDDKVSLLTQGVNIRGKPIELMQTNPLRLDSEGTTRIRVKNIPLSVDDNVIQHTFIQKGLDVITMSRERLRIKGLLTNCQTGDRLVIVKSLSLKEPLPSTLYFGHFVGRVLHFGQPRQDQNKLHDTCGKCLEKGHKKADCKNEWKCLSCKMSGHRKGECSIPEPEPLSGTPSSQDEIVAGETSKTTKNNEVKAKRSGKNKDKNGGQSMLDSFIQAGSSTTDTPNKGRKANVDAKDRTPPTPAERLNERSKKGKLTESDEEPDSDPDSESERS